MKKQISKIDGFKNYFNKKSVTKFIWIIVRSVIIMGLCYLILYPFFIKAVNSFKGVSDFVDPRVRFIPRSLTWDNIHLVYKSMLYPLALRNTLILSLSSAFIQTAICTLIAYGFARFKFIGSNVFFGFVMITLIIPPQTVLVPLFARFSDFFGINFIDTFWPMIILSLTGLGLKNGLYVFMLRQFFKNMPKVLEEAAYIDGYGPWKTFFFIMLPSARAMMLTVFLFAFSWQWTDMFYSNLFFKGTRLMVNSINSIWMASQDPIIQSMLKNTGAMLAILPLIIIYIFAQRFFIQGVERSGIVG